MGERTAGRARSQTRAVWLTGMLVVGALMASSVAGCTSATTTSSVGDNPISREAGAVNDAGPVRVTVVNVSAETMRIWDASMETWKYGKLVEAGQRLTLDLRPEGEQLGSLGTIPDKANKRFVDHSTTYVDFNSPGNPTWVMTARPLKHDSGVQHAFMVGDEQEMLPGFRVKRNADDAGIEQFTVFMG